MAKGGLTIDVTDARGGALSGKLHIELEPHAQAIGGDAMEVSFAVSGHKRFEISNISCHDGPGTLYAFRLTADGYKPYSFFQLMKPRAQNLASEARVRLMANPKKISKVALLPRFVRMTLRGKEALERSRSQRRKRQKSRALLTGLPSRSC